MFSSCFNVGYVFFFMFLISNKIENIICTRVFVVVRRPFRMHFSNKKKPIFSFKKKEKIFIKKISFLFSTAVLHKTYTMKNNLIMCVHVFLFNILFYCTEKRKIKIHIKYCKVINNYASVPTQFINYYVGQF